MPKPFDATLKDLIASHPEDWLAQLGVPITEPPEVLSADFSTVTAAADTLLRVGNLVVHIDVESGPDDSLAERMLLYNVLAHHHTGLPVRTIAVLLRSNAQRASLTDRVAYERLSFVFDIVRVWELPSEDLLRAGIGLMPLALLGKPGAGKTREQALPEHVERIADRVEREMSPEAASIMTATYILAGMHHKAAFVKKVFNKVLAMRESSTYQLILEEGAVEHTRELILKQGRVKLGQPTDKQAAKLGAIQDLERLDRIAVKLLTAKSWDGLLRVT
ncbi:hypothetical protein [Gemmata sp.]|uniref:hypothetical protein n=1 Tax=Gemmata sp. TaxID=1914242 RepID=UPI003F713637